MVSRPRGRPPKYPENEVRRRLLDSARHALREEGITSGLDSISLDGAISDAEVPRGSAYRLWQSDDMTPQDAFRRAVAIEVLREMPTSTGLPITASFATTVVDDLLERSDPDDPEAMRRAGEELIRVVAGDNFDRLDQNRDWQIYSALRTAAFSRRHVDPELADAAEAGETTLIERYADLYERMAGLFDHTIREPFTWTEFSAAAFALNDGLANRATTVYRRRDIPMATGPDDEPREWTLVASAFLALVDWFFVPAATA